MFCVCKFFMSNDGEAAFKLLQLLHIECCSATLKLAEEKVSFCTEKLCFNISKLTVYGDVKVQNLNIQTFF